MPHDYLRTAPKLNEAGSLGAAMAAITVAADHPGVDLQDLGPPTSYTVANADRIPNERAWNPSGSSVAW
jgi:hypothetical protein